MPVIDDILIRLLFILQSKLFYNVVKSFYVLIIYYSHSFILCMGNFDSENLHKLEINDLVLSFIKEPIITAIVPIKAYVDMMESEKFGTLNNIQKEKLVFIQKQIDLLLALISKISIAKLDEIKHDNSLNIL